MPYPNSRYDWVYFRCGFGFCSEQGIYVFKQSEFCIRYGEIFVDTSIQFKCTFLGSVFLFVCSFVPQVIIPTSGYNIYYFYKLLPEQKIRF